MSDKILLVGGGGREDAIARKLCEGGAELYSVLKNRNPSIVSLSKDTLVHDELAEDIILEYALKKKVDLAFIGPDPVLNTNLADKLSANGIGVASPSKAASRIETSKQFMREFVQRNGIPGNIDFKVFTNAGDLKGLLETSDKEYAIKPLGLTGGKGVKVMGVQLKSIGDALEYGKQILERDGKVLLEERISGEEFSLQVFTDGTRIAPFPLVQDFKRAYENDEGPNTGGMGAISSADGQLPFVSSKVSDQAVEILEKIVFHLNKEGYTFRGVIYGQFMQVGTEAKIVEINARFADPESINVLTLLEDDMVEILHEIVDGNLRKKMNFIPKASVLKYVVPRGYGSKPVPSGLKITADELPDDFKIYYAAVSGTLNEVQMSTSRSLALVGLADNIPDASRKVEENLWRIKGDYFLRHDIGTEEMLQSKISRVS